MLAPAGRAARGPGTWADLGCGDGVFTRALASQLAAGSTIHAIDRDRPVLRALPAAMGGVAIQAHRGDFTRLPWPFPAPAGILMANALHYVADQPGFLQAGASQSPVRPHFVIVEYDTDQASRWVPYPVGRAALARLFAEAGYGPVRLLAVRPSIYRRAPLYAAVIAPEPAP